MNDKLKILVVDDEENMLTTLEDIFDAMGYKINTVIDGEKAIRFVREEGADIILMDFKMPGMNGVEAFREIRKIDPSAKVMFITAYYDEDSIEEAMHEGALGVFVKPFEVSEIIERIQSF